MIKVIRREALEQSDYGWLNIEHHFSTPHNPKKKLGPVRVLNHETIQPKTGYDFHQHRDLEMITYVYHGTLTHEDSLNNNHHVYQNHLQFLRAGSGVVHTEKNHQEEQLLMVQIWIDPKHLHLDPDYRVEPLSRDERRNKIVKVVSSESQDGKIKIDQNLNIFILDLDEEHTKTFELRHAKESYLIQLQGQASINHKHLNPGDAMHADETLEIIPITHSHLLIIEIF